MLIWPILVAPLIGALVAVLIGVRRLPLIWLLAVVGSLVQFAWLQFRLRNAVANLLAHPPAGVTIGLGMPLSPAREFASIVTTALFLLTISLLAAIVVKFGLALGTRLRSRGPDVRGPGGRLSNER